MSKFIVRNNSRRDFCIVWLNLKQESITDPRRVKWMANRWPSNLKLLPTEEDASMEGVAVLKEGEPFPHFNLMAWYIIRNENPRFEKEDFYFLTDIESMGKAA